MRPHCLFILPCLILSVSAAGQGIYVVDQAGHTRFSPYTDRYYSSQQYGYKDTQKIYQKQNVKSAVLIDKNNQPVLSLDFDKEGRLLHQSAPALKEHFTVESEYAYQSSGSIITTRHFYDQKLIGIDSTINTVCIRKIDGVNVLYSYVTSLNYKLGNEINERNCFYNSKFYDFGRKRVKIANGLIESGPVYEIFPLSETLPRLFKSNYKTSKFYLCSKTVDVSFTMASANRAARRKAERIRLNETMERTCFVEGEGFNEPPVPEGIVRKPPEEFDPHFYTHKQAFAQNAKGLNDTLFVNYYARSGNTDKPKDQGTPVQAIQRILYTVRYEYYN